MEKIYNGLTYTNEEMSGGGGNNGDNKEYGYG